MVEAKQKFVFDDAAIEQALALVSAAIKPAQIKVELLLSQCREKFINEDFVCSICTFIAWDAKQCGECEQMFCSNCINRWAIKEKSCPNCRQEYVGTKVGRILNNQLNGQYFNCAVEGCSETFLYNEAAQHAANHAVAIIGCVVNCESASRFKGYDAMKTHLQSQCEKILLKCTVCNIKKPRGELNNDDHSCELELMNAADQSETDRIKTKLIEQLVVQSKSQSQALQEQRVIINKQDLKIEQYEVLIQQQAEHISRIEEQIKQHQFEQQQRIGQVESFIAEKLDSILKTQAKQISGLKTLIEPIEDKLYFKASYKYLRDGLAVAAEQIFSYQAYNPQYQQVPVENLFGNPKLKQKRQIPIYSCQPQSQEKVMCNTCMSKTAEWFSPEDEKICFCSYRCFQRKQ